MPAFRIIFLYILSFNLLLASRIIPFGGFVGLCLILIPVLFYSKSGIVKVYMPVHSWWFIIMVIYFAILISVWCFGFLFGVSTSLHQFIIYAGIMFSFMLVLFSTREDILEGYLKIYIKVAVLMSFLGFIAWYLIFSEKVGVGDYQFDGSAIGMHLYSFPYRLALVLTNVDIDASTIGSLVFLRASGWAEEPAWAATFIMPALILLVSNKELFKNRTRIIYITILILFWLVCGAISSIISVLVLIGISQVLELLRKFSLKRLILIVFASILIITPLIYFSSELDIMSGFIESKLSGDAQTLQDTRASVLWVLNPQPDLYHMMMLLALSSALLVFIVSINAIIKGGEVSTYGYIMLYLVLHGAKRGWVWFSFDTFTIFFFYLLLYNLYKQRSTSICKSPDYGNTLAKIA